MFFYVTLSIVMMGTGFGFSFHYCPYQWTSQWCKQSSDSSDPDVWMLAYYSSLAFLNF